MFTPRMFEVPLYGGDYQQRIARSEAKVRDAEKRGPTRPRLAHETTTEAENLLAEHNALVAEAEADGCARVTLRALGRKHWNQLVSDHPPRSGESVSVKVRESDAEVGVNDETFSEALLIASVSAVSDQTTTADLLDQVSSAQYDLLYRTAFALNRDGGPAPKALTPSPSTDETES